MGAGATKFPSSPSAAKKPSVGPAGAGRPSSASPLGAAAATVQKVRLIDTARGGVACHCLLRGWLPGAACYCLGRGGLPLPATAQ